MIVKVSGWIYAVCGVLNLLLISEAGRSWTARAGALASSILVFSIGVGLLRRVNWGRWLALGSSLVTWTLGSIGIMFFVAYMLDATFSARRDNFLLFVTTLVTAAILGAFIVMNFKLFHYLISEDGKFEFNTPENESRPVLKSTALQIAMMLLLGLASGSRGPHWSREPDMGDMLAAMQAAQETQYAQNERQRQEAARQANEEAERRARNERLLLEQTRAQREPQNSYGAMSPREDNSSRIEAQRRELDALRERAAAQRAEFEKRRATAPTRNATTRSRDGFPERVVVPPMTQKSETNQILKCRDASGSVSFTQGYCPAGTQQVETPKPE